MCYKCTTTACTTTIVTTTLNLQDPNWRALLEYCVQNKAYTGCDLPHGIGTTDPVTLSQDRSVSESDSEKCQHNSPNDNPVEVPPESKTCVMATDVLENPNPDRSKDRGMSPGIGVHEREVREVSPGIGGHESEVRGVSPSIGVHEREVRGVSPGIGVHESKVRGVSPDIGVHESEVREVSPGIGAPETDSVGASQDFVEQEEPKQPESDSESENDVEIEEEWETESETNISDTSNTEDTVVTGVIDTQANTTTIVKGIAKSLESNSTEHTVPNYSQAPSLPCRHWWLNAREEFVGEEATKAKSAAMESHSRNEGNRSKSLVESLKSASRNQLHVINRTVKSEKDGADREHSACAANVGDTKQSDWNSHMVDQLLATVGGQSLSPTADMSHGSESLETEIAREVLSSVTMAAKDQSTVRNVDSSMQITISNKQELQPSTSYDRVAMRKQESSARGASGHSSLPATSSKDNQKGLGSGLENVPTTPNSAAADVKQHQQVARSLQKEGVLDWTKACSDLEKKIIRQVEVRVSS